MSGTHTGKFYCQIEEEEMHTAQLNIREYNRGMASFPGITIFYNEKDASSRLNIHVDFILLLGKADFTDEDTKTAIQKIDGFIEYIFGDVNKEIILTRLDYRFDAVVADKSHRKLFMKLYPKTYNKFGFKEKNAQYDSSLYFNSKSAVVLVYDKETERNEKFEPVEPYEENVLRFEVSIRNPHFNYQRRKTGATKSTFNYMTHSEWNNYMKKNISPFFFEGSFRKIHTAETIMKSSSLTLSEQKKLRAFLCDVSKLGLTNAMRIMKIASNGEEKPVYTKYLVKKYLRWLKKLDINPMLIPKNEKVELDADKKIENPLAPLFAELY